MLKLLVAPFILGAAYMTALGVQDGDWKLPTGVFLFVSTAFVGVVFTLSNSSCNPRESAKAESSCLQEKEDGSTRLAS